MASLEETMEAACAAKDIPGAVLVATDATGNYSYPVYSPHQSTLDDGIY